MIRLAAAADAAGARAGVGGGEGVAVGRGVVSAGDVAAESTAEAAVDAAVVGAADIGEAAKGLFDGTSFDRVWEVGTATEKASTIALSCAVIGSFVFTIMLALAVRDAQRYRRGGSPSAAGTRGGGRRRLALQVDVLELQRRAREGRGRGEGDGGGNRSKTSSRDIDAFVARARDSICFSISFNCQRFTARAPTFRGSPPFLRRR